MTGLYVPARHATKSRPVPSGQTKPAVHKRWPLDEFPEEGK